MDKAETDIPAGVDDDAGNTSEDREQRLDSDVGDNREAFKSVDESYNTEPMIHVPEAKSDTAGAGSKSNDGAGFKSNDGAGSKSNDGAGFKSNDGAGSKSYAGAKFDSHAGAGSKNHVEDIRFNTSLKEAEEHYCYFWKEYNPFSQWHASKFTIGGQEFCCAEQYMMYTKAVIQHDDIMAKKILENDDPSKIKALGRKANQYSPDLWYNNCLHVVKDGNRAKFTQNEKLKESLINTYPKILVEASPYDKRWGIGLSKQQESAWNEVTWEGLNLLGYILTELRDELLCEASIIPPEDKKIYFDELTKKLQDSLKNLDMEEHVPHHRRGDHHRGDHHRGDRNRGDHHQGYHHRGDGRKRDGDFKHDRGNADVSRILATANTKSSSSTSPDASKKESASSKSTDAWLKEPWTEQPDDNTEYTTNRNEGSVPKMNIGELVLEDNAETSTTDNSSKAVESKEGNTESINEDLKLV